MKLLAENIGDTLLHVVVDRDMLERPQKAGNQNENKQFGLTEAKKLLHHKGQCISESWPM